MSDKKQRIIYNDVDKVNDYLDNGWLIISIHAWGETIIFLLEKDLTLK